MFIFAVLSLNNFNPVVSYNGYEIIPLVLSRGRSEALHIEKCLLTLCHLVTLNVGNSITQIKGIAEVGTTGRYMKHRPDGVQRLV